MTAVLTDAFVGRVVLGRYRIVRLLAKGGMGRIYLARSEGAAGFVKPVVVKRVLPELVGDELMIKMFEREARIMAGLQHPGIVAVTDFAQEGDDYLLAMEYVHGYNLSRWLRYIKDTRGPFPIEPALQIAIQVLDALHYAHTLSAPDGSPLVVVHRDVTPSNVLVSTDGHVKLLDFGIARSTRESTQPGDGGPKIKGKFPYIAPEVLEGGPATPQSDVYATAVMLHEVLTGRNEIKATDAQRTLINVIRLVPRRLDSVRKDASRALADAVAKGLSKSPDGRYGTAHEFAMALRSVRMLDGDDAQQDLARLAARDLNDPALARLVGTDDLSTLDRAWRGMGPPDSIAGRFDATNPTLLAGSIRDAPTLSAAPTALEPRPTPRGGARTSRAVVAASAIVALAACTGLAVLLLRTAAPPPSAQYVYMQGNVTPITDAGGAAVPPGPEGRRDAGGATARTNVVPVPPLPAAGVGTDGGVLRPHPQVAHTPTSHAAPDQAGVLTRRFAREQGRIMRCFESNPRDVSGDPDLAVRFEIDASGRVSDARIVPSNLAGSGFASCILGIARSVDFGRQPAGVAFRIPITVRRVGGGGPGR